MFLMGRGQTPHVSHGAGADGGGNVLIRTFLACCRTETVGVEREGYWGVSVDEDTGANIK